MPPIRHLPLSPISSQTSATVPYPDPISDIRLGYFSASQIATFLHPVVKQGDSDPNLKYRRVIRRTDPMVLVTFDSASDRLQIFAIPTLSGRRVDVGGWHQLRRTHQFGFPICMCGFEVSIFRITNSSSRPWLNGAYAAACADADTGCKYYVHNLEAFVNAPLRSRGIVVNVFTPEPRQATTLPQAIPSTHQNHALRDLPLLLDEARAGGSFAHTPPSRTTATSSSGSSSGISGRLLSTESPTAYLQAESSGPLLAGDLGTEIEKDASQLSTVAGPIPGNLITRRAPPTPRELQLSTPLSILLEMDRPDVEAGVYQWELRRAITRCNDCGLQRTASTYLSHICPPKPPTAAEKAAREALLHDPFVILLEMDKHDPNSGIYDDELSRAIKKCPKCGIIRTPTYFEAHATACAEGFTSGGGLFSLTIDLTGEDSD